MIDKRDGVECSQENLPRLTRDERKRREEKRKSEEERRNEKRSLPVSFNDPITRARLSPSYLIRFVAWQV